MSNSAFKLDRRKQVVIEPALQRKIVLSIAGPMLVILLLVLGAQMVVDYNVRQGTIDVDGTILGLPERALSAVLFFVFATAWQIIHTLKVSHRIAGAMHRMRVVLRAYRAGDRAVRINLRKNDLQLDLASEINATLDWIAGEAGQAVADRGVESFEAETAGGPASA